MINAGKQSTNMMNAICSRKECSNWLTVDPSESGMLSPIEIMKVGVGFTSEGAGVAREIRRFTTVSLSTGAQQQIQTAKNHDQGCPPKSQSTRYLTNGSFPNAPVSH